MPQWKGNLIVAALLFLGVLVAILPPPSGLEPTAWHLLVIFCTTIVGVILSPKPLSVMALLGGLAAVLTNTLTLSEILGEFSSRVVWLVVLAFFIARGFIKTGLGRRIALSFISLLGGTTLGLGYGMALTEFILSPMIPSVTARSGGIVFPIARSVLEGYPEEATGEKRRSLSAYLMSVCFHSNVITCAMFLTAMAGNPLAVQLAAQKGIHLTWSSWAIGAIVPGLVSLLTIPWILLKMLAPKSAISSTALELARKSYSELGPLSKDEMKMLGVFLLLLMGWIGEPWIGYDATTIALSGVVILFLTNVISWQDAVNEPGAWDTLIWFAVLLSMAGALAQHGVISWLETWLSGGVAGIGWPFSAVLLCGCYFFFHYLFTSATAHISALYMVFLGLLLLTGSPPLFAASLLAYLSSLSASLTHYGNASAPIFFSVRALTVSTWWRSGFVVAATNLLIWGVLGGAWWTMLGWFRAAA